LRPKKQRLSPYQSIETSASVASDTLPAGAEEETLPLPRHGAWRFGAMAMFWVIFEVHPKQEKFDLYLELALAPITPIAPE
jgi:hypothetical protein